MHDSFIEQNVLFIFFLFPKTSHSRDIAHFLSFTEHLDHLHYFAVMNICVMFLTCGHMFLFILSIYLGVKLLDEMEVQGLTFWRTIRLYSKSECTIFLVTIHVWRFPISYIHEYLLFVLLILEILMTVKSYLIVAVICISLMTRNIGCSFMWWLVMCIFYLKKSSLFFSFLSSCKSTLHILGTYILWAIWYVVSCVEYSFFSELLLIVILIYISLLINNVEPFSCAYMAFVDLKEISMSLPVMKTVIFIIVSNR